MLVRNAIGALLMVAMLSSTALAADPPASGTRPAKPGVSMMVPPELDMNQAVDPAKVFARARELRTQADQGNTAAMNALGLLLHMASAGIDHLDAKQQTELQEIAGGLSAGDWFLKAAKAGNPQGVEFACVAAKDPLTRADLRQQSQKTCEQAGKK